MGLFRKRRFYEAAEAHQRAERERRRRERSMRRRFLDSVFTDRNLNCAVASFLLQAFAAPWGLFPIWMVVIGAAPFPLMILLAGTSLIWARNLPEEEEEE